MNIYFVMSTLKLEFILYLSHIKTCYLCNLCSIFTVKLVDKKFDNILFCQGLDL